MTTARLWRAGGDGCWPLAAVLLLASQPDGAERVWVDDEVTFEAEA